MTSCSAWMSVKNNSVKMNCVFMWIYLCSLCFSLRAVVTSLSLNYCMWTAQPLTSYKLIKSKKKVWRNGRGLFLSYRERRIRQYLCYFRAALWGCLCCQQAIFSFTNILHSLTHFINMVKLFFQQLSSASKRRVKHGLGSDRLPDTHSSFDFLFWN